MSRCRNRTMLAAALAFVATGCTGRASHAPLSADDLAAVKADIQKALDQKRQCAPLLRGLEPVTLAADAADHGGTKALLDAGLIEPVSGPPSPPGTRQFRASATAAADVVRRAGVSTMIDLCYGRREVTSVEPLALRPADVGPIVRYRYRIASAPDWANRPDVQRAFPFLEPALTQEFVSRDRIFVKDGHADTSSLSSPLDLDKPPERFDP